MGALTLLYAETSFHCLVLSAYLKNCSEKLFAFNEGFVPESKSCFYYKEVQKSKKYPRIYKNQEKKCE